MGGRLTASTFLAEHGAVTLKELSGRTRAHSPRAPTPQPLIESPPSCWCTAGVHLFPSCTWKAGDSCRGRRSIRLAHARSSQRSPRPRRRSCQVGWAASSQIAGGRGKHSSLSPFSPSLLCVSSCLHLLETTATCTATAAIRLWPWCHGAQPLVRRGFTRAG